MAGHSKWANIQHRKKGQDAKRGKLFTKFIKEISVAARMGGADLDANPRLRLAVDKALSGNMKRDTIERAIQRGAGGLEGADVEEIRYEGYGPNGVAVIVDCLTDNRNRTVAEVRHAFTKCGGNLGTSGSVAYLFNRNGLISFEPGVSEDKVMEIAMESGATDITNNDDGSIDVITEPDDFEAVKKAIDAEGLQPANAEITMIADINVSLDLEQAETMMRLFEMLEDLDDVQSVYSNADIPDDILSQLQ